MRCNMAFIEPMHHNKPSITYFFIDVFVCCFLAVKFVQQLLTTKQILLGSPRLFGGVVLVHVSLSFSVHAGQQLCTHGNRETSNQN